MEILPASYPSARQPANTDHCHYLRPLDGGWEDRPLIQGLGSRAVVSRRRDQEKVRVKDILDATSNASMLVWFRAEDAFATCCQGLEHPDRPTDDRPGVRLFRTAAFGSQRTTFPSRRTTGPVAPGHEAADSFDVREGRDEQALEIGALPVRIGEGLFPECSTPLFPGGCEMLGVGIDYEVTGPQVAPATDQARSIP